MRASASRALWMIGTLALAATPSFAQEPGDSNNTGVREAPLTPEESAILSNALTFDPAALATPPKKSLRLPGSPDSTGYDIKRTEKPDGSSTVVVKRPLPTEWDNSVGAELGPANTNPGSAFDRPLPSTRDNSSGGSAWASLGVPNIGSIDARVDPSREQGKLGTTLRQSVPFAGRFAVTVQGTYSVTETFAQSSPGPDMPMMALPSSTNLTAPQVFSNERAVKFNILPTGTTLGAGMTTLSNDPATHNTLTAEQKLYGPLQVTTAVTDVGRATSSKSISAGFKLHW